MNDALEQMAIAYWENGAGALTWEDACREMPMLADDIRTGMRAAIAAIPEDSDALIHEMCAAYFGDGCDKCTPSDGCFGRRETIKIIAALKAALLESGDG